MDYILVIYGYTAPEDEDVARERERIESGSLPTSDPVVVKNLTHVFKTKANPNLVAVNNLSFGLKPAECFGLLGVNGAGKSTTFRMLTGELNMTNGMTLVNGYNVYSQVADARQFMGYCPQYDGLYGWYNV